MEAKPVWSEYSAVAGSCGPPSLEISSPVISHMEAYMAILCSHPPGSSNAGASVQTEIRVRGFWACPSVVLPKLTWEALAYAIFLNRSEREAEFFRFHGEDSKSLKTLETCTQWLSLLEKLENGKCPPQKVLTEHAFKAVPGQVHPSSVCHHCKGSSSWLHHRRQLGRHRALVVAFGHALFQGLP